MVSFFQEIIAIDLSDGMLDVARNRQREAGIASVRFAKQDAMARLPYADGTFDVIYNRRGPQNFPESFRVLKPDATYLEIRIGEKDCQAIKEIFGRGQDYGRWFNPVLEQDRARPEQVGFRVVYARDFRYLEYYPTRRDLSLFLQGVPIFEDYDPEQDSEKLDAYVASNQEDEGIRLERHRVVFRAQKP